MKVSMSAYNALEAKVASLERIAEGAQAVVDAYGGDQESLVQGIVWLNFALAARQGVIQ